MTILLTIANKQAQAATLAAQYAEFLASGGRVLQVTKDTVIEPQSQAKWVAPTTAKPLQVIAAKNTAQPAAVAAKPKPKPKHLRFNITSPRQNCPNTIVGKQRRADILEYMRNIGTPVSRQMIAEHVGMTVHGGLKHQILQLIKSRLINVSYRAGKGGKEFYEVAK